MDAQLYDKIVRNVVRLKIDELEAEEPFYRSGIVLSCTLDSACVMADARDFLGRIETTHITVTFPDGQESMPLSNQFYVYDGKVCIFCKIGGCFESNGVKGIDICEQPVRIFQAVYVYESVSMTLTDGYIMQIHGNYFEHNCGVAKGTKFRAPVFNISGQVVGISDSAHYHLSVRRISSLWDTIQTIEATLREQTL